MPFYFLGNILGAFSWTQTRLLWNHLGCPAGSRGEPDSSKGEYPDRTKASAIRDIIPGGQTVARSPWSFCRSLREMKRTR